MDREQMILKNLGLVHMVVKRFINRGHDREELFQIGTIGLMKAVDRYDIETGYSFSTYAVPMIIGEIQRFLRDDGLIHISRGIKENARKIAIVRENIKKTENREATIDEISQLSGVNKDDVLMASEAMLPVDSEIQELMGTEDENIEGVVDKITVRELIKELEPMDKRLICLRYIEQRSQAQVGEILGMSQVTVSRREKKLLSELRCKMV